MNIEWNISLKLFTRRYIITVLSDVLSALRITCLFFVLFPGQSSGSVRLQNSMLMSFVLTSVSIISRTME